MTCDIKKMGKYNLGFMSDEAIFEHVKNTVLRYRIDISLRDFNQNIIDPIKLSFDAKVYGKTMKEVIETECLRQIDKSNQNHIGYFHQNIFKYADGWDVPNEGFDVVNEGKHLFAELKNKHNTMNSRSAHAVYMFMQNKLLHDDKATCMLVEVIAKRSQNVKWTCEGYSHERIRRVSIDKFYEIVFGDKDAFFKLCRALPVILDDVLSEMKLGRIQNTVYEELETYSHDLLKSLYLLAFKTYEGFENIEEK